MSGITVQELAEQGRPVDLVILSLEGSVYLCHALVAGVRHPVLNAERRPLQAYSTTAMRRLLAGLSIASATLEQEMPYDEMIGLPPGERCISRMPLHWAGGHPDTDAPPVG